MEAPTERLLKRERRVGIRTNREVRLGRSFGSLPRAGLHGGDGDDCSAVETRVLVPAW